MPDHPPDRAATPRLGYRATFEVFFKAGLAFGGGVSILGALERELVERRRLLRRADFLAIYSLGRIVPSGTSTALAVAYGYRLAGWLGTAIALAALILPGFVLTVLLAAAYTSLRTTPYFVYVPVTLLPASLAFIVAAAYRLGRDVFRPSVDLLIAIVAFVGAAILGISPALLLIAGGLVGIVVFARETGAKK